MLSALLLTHVRRGGREERRFPSFPSLHFLGRWLPTTVPRFLILTKKNALTRKETDGKGGML